MSAPTNTGPGTYWVRMTVSTEVEAESYADALQKGCDVVHPLVLENRLSVHDVSGHLTSLTGDQCEAVRTYLRPDRTLAPKTSQAIEAVLRAAWEQFRGKE